MPMRIIDRSLKRYIPLTDESFSPAEINVADRQAHATKHARIQSKEEEEVNVITTTASTTETIVPKKTVRFMSRVLVRPTLHINDYTDEEFHATWYNDKEVTLRQYEIAATVQMVVRHRSLPSNMTVRGLEQRTSRKKINHARQRLASIHVVLKEQEQFRQNEQERKQKEYEGTIITHDWVPQSAHECQKEECNRIQAAAEVIRKRYIKATRTSQETAIKLGKRDARTLTGRYRI